MKIILCVILIMIFAAIAYGLYIRISSADASAISESISSAFDNAADWIANAVNALNDLMGE